MGLFVRVLTLIRCLFVRGLNALNRGLRKAAAWVGWPLTIIIVGCTGTFIGLSDIVVYLLTVQTAVSASVADITQQHNQEEDDKRDKRNDAILSEIRKNSKMMLAAVATTNSLLEVLVKGGLSNVKPGRAKSARKTARRRNRA